MSAEKKASEEHSEYAARLLVATFHDDSEAVRNGDLLAAILRLLDAERAKVARVEALLGEPQVPVYDAENGNSFEGFASGRRQDHRTVGPHRAWSDAGEWCYPSTPCSWCEQKIEPTDLREALAGRREKVKPTCDACDRPNGGHRSWCPA